MRFETITSAKGAKLQIDFGGQHAQRPQEIIDVDEFIGIKSHRAKGKRLTTYEVAMLTFIEPEVEEIEDESLGNLEDEMINDEEFDGEENFYDDNSDDIEIEVEEDEVEDEVKQKTSTPDHKDDSSDADPDPDADADKDSESLAEEPTTPSKTSRARSGVKSPKSNKSSEESESGFSTAQLNLF